MESSPTLTRRQSREFDRRAMEEYGMPGIVLMENAGRGVAEKIMELGLGGSVALCCGKGNNGGDGFVIARHLDAFGASVRVLLWASPSELSGDAATNYRIIQAAEIPIEIFGKDDPPERIDDALRGVDTIVDALLGTGAHGEPRAPFDRAIDRMNASGSPILAVDLPSGLDCDTGQAASHAIFAAHTCTFVAPKPGFGVPNAKRFVGQLHVIRIGAPRRLVNAVIQG